MTLRETYNAFYRRARQWSRARPNDSALWIVDAVYVQMSDCGYDLDQLDFLHAAVKDVLYWKSTSKTPGNPDYVFASFVEGKGAKKNRSIRHYCVDSWDRVRWKKIKLPR